MGSREVRYWLLVIALYPVACFSQNSRTEAEEPRPAEEYFRTSEQPGETPVNRRQRERGTRRFSAPPGAARVGCLCMDDTPSKATSVGACSGHGGVRYWLYAQPNGDTLRVPTARHEQHPQPLDSLERTELVSPTKRKQHPPTSAQAPTVIIVQMLPPPDNDPFTLPTWPETLGIIGLSLIALAALYILLLWAHAQIPFLLDALRDYLRYRRRPPEDPDR